jgi:hypothetical protein
MSIAKMALLNAINEIGTTIKELNTPCCTRIRKSNPKGTAVRLDMDIIDCIPAGNLNSTVLYFCRKQLHLLEDIGPSTEQLAEIWRLRNIQRELMNSVKSIDGFSTASKNNYIKDSKIKSTALRLDTEIITILDSYGPISTQINQICREELGLGNRKEFAA